MLFKKQFLLLCFILFVLQVNAQTEDAWVFFKDKPTTSLLLNSPLKIVSQRALDRRLRYKIPLDIKDAPIEPSYMVAVKQQGDINVLAKSKWLNALHIKGRKEQISTLLNLSFVEKIEFANKSLNISGKEYSAEKELSTSEKLKIEISYNYGNAQNQIEMLHGDFLHEKNFTGNDILIAIMDAGFPNVDKFEAFQNLRENNQILGGYNYVERSENIFARHSHGTSVLSTIGGVIENEFVGTAPNANFYLFITEDDSKETPLEESLWVEAVEKADSLGVDIVNTSLGYATFDNSNYNYSYQDMDGKTTFISRGASVAFTRGMILVNSAGNEGNNSWKYMMSPADSENVLSIGAVNSDGIIANFSSFGPTADGRIKPDVCAQGFNAAVISSSGEISTSNGTSFSSPILAGVIACLWEAFPEVKNVELIQLIKEFSHLYHSPTSQEGYGIPNFELLFNYINENRIVVSNFNVYPNPTSGSIYFEFPSDEHEATVSIINLLGKTIVQEQVFKIAPKMEIDFLNKGVYFVQVKTKKKTVIMKLLKE